MQYEDPATRSIAYAWNMLSQKPLPKAKSDLKASGTRKRVVVAFYFPILYTEIVTGMRFVVPSKSNGSEPHSIECLDRSGTMCKSESFDH